MRFGRLPTFARSEKCCTFSVKISRVGEIGVVLFFWGGAVLSPSLDPLEQTPSCFFRLWIKSRSVLCVSFCFASLCSLTAHHCL